MKTTQLSLPAGFWASILVLTLTPLGLAAQTAPAATAPGGAQTPAATQTAPAQTTQTPPQTTPAAPPPQPKRILGLMPNYRAVSAGVKPPPATPKEAFKIATENSFDYSAFVFVGITSAFAKVSDAHPKLGEGVDGFAQYYWRGYLDKTDGNYMVTFVMPTILHEDERYYALGQGGFWKRLEYSSTRVLITPNYDGHNTLNGAELFGRGTAEGLSAFYYPKTERTVGGVATMFGYAVGRDAFTNVFREFWPDIAIHVLHRQP